MSAGTLFADIGRTPTWPVILPQAKRARSTRSLNYRVSASAPPENISSFAKRDCYNRPLLPLALDKGFSHRVPGSEKLCLPLLGGRYVVLLCTKEQ